jgi:hypothetical protein
MTGASSAVGAAVAADDQPSTIDATPGTEVDQSMISGFMVKMTHGTMPSPFSIEAIGVANTPANRAATATKAVKRIVVLREGTAEQSIT